MIIRQLEKEGLGIVIKSPCTSKTQQKLVVLFVNNTDLVTDGELAKQSVQRMIDECDGEYAAMEG